MSYSIKQVDELEGYFSKTKLPVSIQLDAGIKVEDVARFVESHLNVLCNNPDKPIYEPFYNRLLLLKQLLTT